MKTPIYKFEDKLRPFKIQLGASGAKGKHMKYRILLASAILLFTGCNSGDQTANHVFDAVQQSEFLNTAISVPCDREIKTQAVSFQENCWTRDITDIEIEALGEESLALGLIIREAFEMPVDVIEKRSDGSMLARVKTQGDCAHFLKAYFTPPLRDLTGSDRIKIRIGITKEPYCEELDLDGVS